MIDFLGLISFYEDLVDFKDGKKLYILITF